MNPTEVAQTLIRKASISPDDAGCQDYIACLLNDMGFQVTHLPFGDVKNLWATYGGENPEFIFAGHTDVVPAGNKSEWIHPPFAANIHDGILYGRGAADMKGSLAAMIYAAERIIQNKPHCSLGFLITSDEEGDAINGTKKVVEHLIENNFTPKYCIIGEPSSLEQIGDQIRIGRRGSLSANLTVKGKQGHVAYPDKAINAISLSNQIIADLTAESWDQGNEHFPATSFQISNIHAGTGANNVVPGECEIMFNFRYSNELNAETIQSRVKNIIAKTTRQYSIQWQHSGEPFITKQGKLIEIASEVISNSISKPPILSTSGGISDGRFIVKTGAEVIELGLLNHSIHAIDEHVAVAEIEDLANVYLKILATLL